MPSVTLADQPGVAHAHLDRDPLTTVREATDLHYPC